MTALAWVPVGKASGWLLAVTCFAQRSRWPPPPAPTLGDAASASLRAVSLRSLRFRPVVEEALPWKLVSLCSQDARLRALSVLVHLQVTVTFQHSHRRAVSVVALVGIFDFCLAGAYACALVGLQHFLSEGWLVHVFIFLDETRQVLPRQFADVLDLDQIP